MNTRAEIYTTSTFSVRLHHHHISLTRSQDISRLLKQALETSRLVWNIRGITFYKIQSELRLIFYVTRNIYLKVLANIST